MRAHALVIPALVEDTGDALHPFVHFIVFVVRREARRRFREAVVPHCEARGCSCLHGLQNRAGRVNEVMERNATRRGGGGIVFWRNIRTVLFAMSW